MTGTFSLGGRGAGGGGGGRVKGWIEWVGWVDRGVERKG